MVNWNFYISKTGVCVLPYLGIHYYKSQGETSIGCLKYMINFGWIIFNCQISTKHK